MSAVSGLIAKHFAADQGCLRIGGLSVVDLADRYGTPCFMYDAGIMDKKVRQLRTALPEDFQISYSVKANPNKAVLERFLTLGCGLEIASAGEFAAALAAGGSPSQIIFAGPGKTEAELDLVLAKGIGEIHVESQAEIARIAAIASRLGVRAKVALRINPTGEAQGGAMRMGGRAAPFGVDEEIAGEVIHRILSMPSLEFVGIHLFTGTQILDSDILLTQYQKGITLARSIADGVKHPLQTVDFGGGLGIPYFPNEQELNLDRLRDGLRFLMMEVSQDPLFLKTRFMVEPGRFLVGESGVFVSRVTDIKQSRGKQFVILDGGMNCHLAASGNLGQTIKRNYPIAVVNKLQESNGHVVDVVGPLCTPLDTLGRNVEFPLVEIGDLVGVFQSGAYGLTASPVNFLSHASAAEVLIADGSARVIRMRGALSAASSGIL